jgi:hypothetical protein
MAYYRGLRYAVLAAAAVMLGTITTATTAPDSYFDSGGGTLSTMSPFDNNIIMLSYADYQPAVEFKAVAEHQRIASYYPAFRDMPRKERASRSAVRPTAVSGWRSGRVRTLAG